MAELQKAQITYTTEGGAESVLRFHSVIAEDHDVSNELTKFPVQSGFNVSNHAIKKNRKVSIIGVVSNHIIVGGEEAHEYGGNNSRIMFETLKDLVRGAVPCDVVTNYGDYSPVIFNRFKTKLQAGETDIMKFTLSGEEIQVGGSGVKEAPTLLNFTPLEGAERARRIEELGAIGLNVSSLAEISEAPVDVNDSFQFSTKATNGEEMLVTYDKVSFDPTTHQYSHEVSTSDTDVAGGKDTYGFNWFQMMQEEGNGTSKIIDLGAGMSVASACLSDSIIGAAKDATSGLINTSLGELKKTIYGAAYGIFGVNGNQSFGQIMLSMGVDCLVAGAIGSADDELTSDDFQENNIPTVDEIKAGAASIGDSVATDTLGVAAPTTLTKISDASGNTSFFGDLIG